ncbi:MAG TPA: ArsR family transcriptional regulator [Treponema sp.]|nr:ArsR family transcriptional regulator [Treponema sp.]
MNKATRDARDTRDARNVPPACCTIDLDGAERERFTGMLKAAGNPVRFEILSFLVTHPGCITGDIVSHLPIAQATVSQHLKVLRTAGWIEGEIEGPAVCYSLSADAIAWFRLTVARIF